MTRSSRSAVRRGAVARCRRAYPVFTGSERDSNRDALYSERQDPHNTKEHHMNQHHFTHVLRHPIVDSPKRAQRREQLWQLEAEHREARRRRRRQRIRRAWNRLGMSYAKRSDDSIWSPEAPEPGRAPR
jgi:hypothetical protein